MRFFGRRTEPKTRDDNLRNDIERIGPWVDHNIRLSAQVATRGIENGQNLKIRQVMEVLISLLGPTLEGCSVLDLACLEGGYSIEAALLGARVVGIEGRERNLEKCLFAKQTLKIDNVDFRLGDVRNISSAEIATFDIILCMGILYHLDNPFSMLKLLSSLCNRYLVVDTHIAYENDDEHRGVVQELRGKLSGLTSLFADGESYLGRYYREFRPNTSPQSKEKSVQSSLDNEQSFWPTTSSLFRMLNKAGFNFVWQYWGLPHGTTWSSHNFARVLIIGSKNDVNYQSPLWNS